jgi:hypothetical protein
MAERSCNTVHRLKTYLNSTIGQEGLNIIILLNIHEKHTDKVDMCAVTRDFVALNELIDF